jgi:hypothetical protein
MPIVASRRRGALEGAGAGLLFGALAFPIEVARWFTGLPHVMPTPGWTGIALWFAACALAGAVVSALRTRFGAPVVRYGAPALGGALLAIVFVRVDQGFDVTTGAEWLVVAAIGTALAALAALWWRVAP